MKNLAPSLQIVAVPTPRDINLSLSFTPGDALGMTEIDIPGAECLTAERYMALIEEAATRLIIYSQGFRQAARDANPTDETLDHLHRWYAQARADGDERAMDRLADDIGITRAEIAHARAVQP